MKAAFGFTTTTPTYSLINSKTIEIHDLKALEPGDLVKFTVSSICMPRYQGTVKQPLTVSIIESTTGNLIDAYEFLYFVQEAALWDYVDLSLSSHQNRSPTEVKISFSKVQSGITVTSEDRLVFGLPKEVSVDLNTLNCRLDDIEKHCEFN